MNQERVKRKLIAILSADAVGYSRLMGEDEVATVHTLEAYRNVMSDLIAQFRGRVVDSPGDNLLAEFYSVVDAVECAVEIHEVIRARNEELPKNRRMVFRIGVNLGDVIEEGDRIYGDGVNIAARLEGLAEAGGICISGSAHEQIENKLTLAYEYLGEHTVKNIVKPVKVYRIPLEPRAATSSEQMAYPLPDKPSIAVLPFKNETGYPDQDYIGDCLSRSICDALSVSSQMFVIDRNATIIYKETPVKPQQVSKDLGVQYILDGSIQKSGDRLRVTAQLTDALAGHYLWSEKYDRDMNMKELFEIQDEITKKIMVSLEVELSDWGEDTSVLAKSTDNLEAWKYFFRGLELSMNFIEEDNVKARQYLEAALKLDPGYVAAMSLLGFTHLLDFQMEWSDSPYTSINHAFEFEQKAVELDEQDPYAHALLGFIYVYQGQHEKAIFEGKQAISLNPNFALGYGLAGYILSLCGQYDEAEILTKKAYRLNPNLHPILLIGLARSYVFMRRYEKALEVCDEIEKQIQNGRLGVFKYAPPLFSSWIYQELGRDEKAHSYMIEALKRNPDYSLGKNTLANPYKHPDHLKRMQDALLKAGLPEHPPGVVQETF